MSVSVIIPSRTITNLVPCVAAIRKEEKRIRIIVVDDGLDFTVPNRESEDGCWLCDMDTTLRLAGEKPFIFARNINIGIRAAGTDDVILLNDDALLRTPDGFHSMWLMSRSRPEFGVIAASCNNVGNLNQHQHPGDGLREEPRMVCFVCVLIPRATIDEVGLLDEEFVGYGLDDDSYCLRARKAGLKIGVFDGCFVDHHSLVSTFRQPSPTNSSPGDFKPNMKIFIAKYGVDNWGRDRETSPYRDLFPPLVGVKAKR